MASSGARLAGDRPRTAVIFTAKLGDTGQRLRAAPSTVHHQLAIRIRFPGVRNLLSVGARRRAPPLGDCATVRAHTKPRGPGMETP